MHGDDPQPRLCEQVCLLLEVMSSRAKLQQHSRQNVTQNKPSKTSVKEVGPSYPTEIEDNSIIFKSNVFIWEVLLRELY